MIPGVLEKSKYSELQMLFVFKCYNVVKSTEQKKLQTYRGAFNNDPLKLKCTADIKTFRPNDLGPLNRIEGYTCNY